MTSNTVQPITDEQLAEIERFLEFGGAMLKTKSEAWRGVISRLRAAEKDQARYQELRNSNDWPAVFADHDSPEPLRGYELDAAIDAAMHQG